MRNTRREKGAHFLTIIAVSVSSSFIHVSLLKPSVIAVFVLRVLFVFWGFGLKTFWRWRYRKYGVEATRYVRGWCSIIADFDSGIGEGYFSLLTILSL